MESHTILPVEQRAHVLRKQSNAMFISEGHFEFQLGPSFQPAVYLPAMWQGYSGFGLMQENARRCTQRPIQDANMMHKVTT